MFYYDLHYVGCEMLLYASVVGISARDRIVIFPDRTFNRMQKVLREPMICRTEGRLHALNKTAPTSHEHLRLPMIIPKTSAATSPHEVTVASGFAEVSDAKLFYETAGKGQPVLLIHGGGLDGGMWDDQFQVLAQHYQVVRYDLRGLGKSELPKERFSHVQDLHRLLKSLSVDKAPIIGLSLGGRIAIDFALEHPEMATALVLASSGLSGRVLADDYLKKLSVILSTAKQGDVQAAIELWLNSPLLGPIHENRAGRQKVRQILEDNQHVFRLDSTLEIEVERMAVGRLAEIKVPTLIIVGDRDHADILAIADKLQLGITGARKVVIKGAGHLVNMDKPEEFNRIVLAFLNEIHPPRV